jgi:hypothetical protein
MLVVLVAQIGAPITAVNNIDRKFSSQAQLIVQLDKTKCRRAPLSSSKKWPQIVLNSSQNSVSSTKNVGEQGSSHWNYIREQRSASQKTPRELSTAQLNEGISSNPRVLDTKHEQVWQADIPCSLGGGRRGFDPCQLRRTKRAFIPPLAIWNEA